MTFRAKLFLLLLSLSVLPIVALRLSGVHTLELLATDLVDRSAHLLVLKARNHLLLLVEDHANILHRERQLLTQTLRLQAAEVEKALAAPGGASRRAPTKTPSSPAGATRIPGPDAAAEASTQPPQAGPPSPDAPDVQCDADGLPVPASPEPGAQTLFSSAYQTAGAVARGLFWDQATALENGFVEFSSGQAALPRRYNPRLTPWYQAAINATAPVWTAPAVDPATRRIALTVSMPVRDPAGAVAGVTAIMVRMDTSAMGGSHGRDISPHLKSYLVHVSDQPGESQGLRIIGQEEHQFHDGGAGSRRMGMMGLVAPQWLIPDDPAVLAEIKTDLLAGKSDVREARLSGQDVMWAYAPSGMKGGALVITAPVADVQADAAAATVYIHTRVDSQIAATWVVVGAALLAVAGTAWLVARSLTRPVLNLCRAAERVGQGDFTAQVVPEGGSELAELGRTFNAMTLHMEDRSRLRQAMALAQEVQGSLLPLSMPVLPGLDIAATSRYCDETGGDYYDAVTDAHGQPGRVALLVGDVSGHGIDAALLMTTARAFLRMGVHQPGTPAQVIDTVNSFLAADTSGTGRFMTLFYLEFDAPGAELPSGGPLNWVRAGHDPAMLYCAATGVFEELGGRGIPLGVLESHHYSEYSRQPLSPGDVLLIGSDGMWEARDSAGAMFGKDHVREIIRANANAQAEAIITALLAALDAFLGGIPADDDVTLMVIKAKA